MKRLHGLALLAAVLALGVFTGTGVAGGNGHGNSGSAPGNSANAPGQQKQASDQQSQQQTTQQQTAQQSTQQSSQQSAPPGQAKKGSGSSPSGGQNSSSSTPGMKPANNTSKRTLCTTGSSTPSCGIVSGHGTCTKTDCSKRYGNGKTAAGIAQSRGAPKGTPIYGPGNSQPHKVYDCRKGHWVDVHAVKDYASLGCTSTTTSTPTGTTPTTTAATTTAMTTTSSTTGATTTTGTTTTGTTTTGTTTTGTTTTGTTTTGTTTTGTTTTGTTTTSASAVLGASATPPSGKGGVLGARKTIASRPVSHPTHGVLGAVARVATGTLPFTGFPVWAAVLLALFLGGAGFFARRWAGGTAQS